MESPSLVERTINYRNAPIFYGTSGEGGKAVLFCHGDAQNHTAGLSLVEAFPTAYKRICIDFPGHGRSAEIPHRTLAVESELMRCILEAERVEKAILIGHSKGAALAGVFATQHAKQVEALVLINPFFEDPKKIFWYLPVNFLMRRYLCAAQGKCAPEGVYHTYGDERSEEEIHALGFKHTPYAVLERNLQLYEGYDIRSALQMVEAPILIVASTQDKLTSLRHLRKTTKGMQNVRIESIAATHNPHLLAKSDVQSAVRKNLDFLLHV